MCSKAPLGVPHWKMMRKKYTVEMTVMSASM
jgi:hypothetical protein